MTTYDDPACHDAMAQALEATGQYRVLRRLTDDLGLPKTEDDDSDGSPSPDCKTCRIGCVVDVETAGLDVDRHPIIELALRRFWFDDAGAITALDQPHAWRQDPGAPLDPKIVALTGLRDEDLAGRAIDDEVASALLCSAEVVVAHNAGFDRKFVEHRLPAATGLAWACSMREIDWSSRGLDGLGLGWLLAQCGWYHGAHRAGADVDAVLAILGHRRAVERTALAELLDTAGTPGCRFAAVGAHFDVKDRLKGRGYRWDPATSVWHREVRADERTAEERWLDENVYAPWHEPRAFGPAVTEVTWHTRHG